MTRRLALLALLTGVLVAAAGPHDHARAAFGGTNGRIAFVRYTGGAPLEEVHMVSPASGLTANLTNDPATGDTAPAWSPDGDWIVFSRDAGGDAELWMVRADGTDLVQLTANADEDREDRPGHQRAGRGPAAELAAAVASAPRMLELAAARS
jgi:hypothetical protein